MVKDAIRDGPLKLDNPMLLPFNDGPYLVYERRRGIESLESTEESYPGFPWTHYGPLDPGKTEDLELHHDEAGTRGHRYLLCAPYLPGFLVQKKECGKRESALAHSEATLYHWTFD